MGYGFSTGRFVRPETHGEIQLIATRSAYFSQNLAQTQDFQYSVRDMNTVKAYEEVVDFIAAGTTPQNVIAFRPSEASQERVTGLLEREKSGELAPGEKSELDNYMQIEHLMRLAKARARDFLPHE